MRTVSHGYQSAAAALEKATVYWAPCSDGEDLRAFRWVCCRPCFSWRWMQAHCPLYDPLPPTQSLPSTMHHPLELAGCEPECGHSQVNTGFPWQSTPVLKGERRYGAKPALLRILMYALCVTICAWNSKGYQLSWTLTHACTRIPFVTELHRIMKVTCISGLDHTSRELQPSLLPAVVSH